MSHIKDGYSIPYFLRPEDETRFEDIEGSTPNPKVKLQVELEAVTVPVDWYWHDDEYVVFAEPQERRSMLTSGILESW